LFFVASLLLKHAATWVAHRMQMHCEHGVVVG
jgi:hypothetical protein